LTDLISTVSLETFKDWPEVSGATKLDGGERLLVSCKDSSDSLDLWILLVACHWEAVAQLLLCHVPSYTTESKHRELTVIIVLFNNATDLADGGFVLILRSHRMERVWSTLVTV
jgi:hypothetical protein